LLAGLGIVAAIPIYQGTREDNPAIGGVPSGLLGLDRPGPWQPTPSNAKAVWSLKPVIKASTNRGDVVLDPFCGSGSALLAAKILGRRYIGIEIDAHQYTKSAQARL
jgi:DNA modification methylase